MPMTAQQIETMIKSGIPDATIELKDLAGDNDHWAEHQMVYAALGGNMGDVLHALALTTGVPSES